MYQTCRSKLDFSSSLRFLLLHSLKHSLLHLLKLTSELDPNNLTNTSNISHGENWPLQSKYEFAGHKMTLTELYYPELTAITWLHSTFVLNAESPSPEGARVGA